MANQIGNAILDTNALFINLDEFDDVAQVKEIVEILAKDGGLTIRASACQGIITFFNEDYGTAS